MALYLVFMRGVLIALLLNQINVRCLDLSRHPASFGMQGIVDGTKKIPDIEKPNINFDNKNNIFQSYHDKAAPSFEDFITGSDGIETAPLKNSFLHVGDEYGWIKRLRNNGTEENPGEREALRKRLREKYGLVGTQSKASWWRKEKQPEKEVCEETILTMGPQEFNDFMNRLRRLYRRFKSWVKRQAARAKFHAQKGWDTMKGKLGFKNKGSMYWKGRKLTLGAKEAFDKTKEGTRNLFEDITSD